MRHMDQFPAPRSQQGPQQQNKQQEQLAEETLPDIFGASGEGSIFDVISRSQDSFPGAGKAHSSYFPYLIS